MSEQIIWNNTKYAEQLSGFFGYKNVITSPENFPDLIKNWSQYNSLIVLCELNWTSKGASTKLQHLQGIELVKELRRTHDVTLPVLFVSFFPLIKIFTAEREILTAIGHEFYQLPAKPEDLKSLLQKDSFEEETKRKLSPMELNDIKSFYCSKEGVLSHELHSLNKYLNLDINKKNYGSIYSDLQNTIKKIHELFLVDAVEALFQFESTYQTLSKENINEAVEFIKRLGNSLQNKYGNNSDVTANESNTEIFKWKVLLLDDEIDDQHKLVKTMNASGINVICADNASDAKNILIGDWQTEQSIMAVIADYRLYEKGSKVKKHQKIQGYKFLKDISASDHLIRLIAFSGLPRKFLLNSFKHYNLRTEVKSKMDYLSDDHSMQMFCNEIIEIAEENWEAIEALPSKCEGFKNTLQTAYILFRSSPAYSKMEAIISKDSSELIKILKDKNFKVPLNLEFIGSTFESNKKASKLGDEKKEFSYPEKYLKNPDAYFNRFRIYLVGRRIALWIYIAGKKGLIPTIETRMIAELLTGNKYATQKEEYSEGAYRQIFSTNLGIKFEDFPTNITIEERRWLQYDMELNIFRDVEATNSSFKKIKNYFSEFISSDESLCDNISNNDFALSYKYKKSDYRILFNRNIVPVLSTPTDVRVLYLIIEKHIGKDNRVSNLISELVSKIQNTLLIGLKDSIYLNNLFEYFNTILREVREEKGIIKSPSTEIISKESFSKKATSSINELFEEVFQLFKDNKEPERTASSDLCSIYRSGIFAKMTLGEINESNKSHFFKLIIEEQNLEYKNHFTSLEDFKLNKKSRKDFESGEE